MLHLLAAEHLQRHPESALRAALGHARYQQLARALPEGDTPEARLVRADPAAVREVTHRLAFGDPALSSSFRRCEFPGGESILRKSFAEKLAALILFA